MRRLFLAALAALGLTAGAAHASWYSYYKAVESASTQMQIDWVKYYKQFGSSTGFALPVDAHGNPQRINYAPNFISPQMQWAVPNPWLPAGPPAPPPAYGIPY